MNITEQALTEHQLRASQWDKRHEDAWDTPLASGFESQ